MWTQYYCKNPRRKAEVRNNPVLNGIDYLEVSPYQKTLNVYFIHNLPWKSVTPPEPALTKENVIIEGGVRVKGICVESVLSYKNNIFTLYVNAPGDFSTYTLRLVTSPTEFTPPTGFDPLLSEVEFSFKVSCPNDFDCKPAGVCLPEKQPEPLIDYMAKDYASFRRLMLDRLSMIMPDWKERNPADAGIALVEIMAYAADHLSYYQDAVATEAYLGTARKRISVRRHARLLDYFMHDGCNARAWVQVQVNADNVFMEKGTQMLTRLVGHEKRIDPDSDAYNQAIEQQPEVFEAMHDIILCKAHNLMHFYTWSDEMCCLPKGAIRAWLRDDPGNRLHLRRGDVLIFEERVGLNTNLEGDANPAHRHAVRLTRVYPEAKEGRSGRTPSGIVNDPLNNQAYVEIEWDAQDALPFPLCISTKINGELVENVSAALGNIVLADHGRTMPEEELSEVLPGRSYRPKLKFGPLTQQGRVKDFVDPRLVLFDPKVPASHAFHWELRDVLPAVGLNKNEWTVQRDLLSSDRFARDFVVEIEEDGYAYLRFDDRLGKLPIRGLKATYRIGNGSAGNVGAEAIAHVVTNNSKIIDVRNPLPALGGVDPEPIEQVRLYAPQAFRTQNRAVTESDYAEVTQRHPEVQKAVATLRWTGSWYTMFIAVDRKGGRPADAEFETNLRDFLERFRMAGYDLEIEGPRFVPLDIAMTVCVAPGYFISDVKAALLETFSNKDLSDGRHGFFHPDNFTFGQPVYLSQIITTAMKVPGVLWVDIDDKYPKPNRFRRWGQDSHGELADGQITMGHLEIARLDNGPDEPENGKIEFYMEGGL